MTTLKDIEKRLAEADGPDRELDGAIASAFELPQQYFNQFTEDVDGNPFEGFDSDRVDGPDCYYDAATWGGGGRAYVAPGFTASIDAAIELVEKILPERTSISLLKSETVLTTRGSGPWACDLYDTTGPDGEKYGRHIGVGWETTAEGKSPALALCLALVRAKIAEGE